MKVQTSGKTLNLTLAAAAVAGALFTGNANAMADPGYRYPMPQVSGEQRIDDARIGMRFVGEPVGWVRVPGADTTTRTVNLEGRVVEGRGLIFAPKQED